MDTLSIYINKYSFLTELMIIESLFLYSQKKKNGFFFRLLFTLLVCFAAAGIIAFNGKTVFDVSRYFILFFVTLLSIGFCFELSPQHILFYGVASYAIQHSAYSLGNLLTLFLQNTPHHFDIIALVSPIPFYLILWWFFSKKLRVNSENSLNNISFLILSTSIVMITVILNYMRFLYLPNNNQIMHAVCSFYAVFSCLLALSLQFGLLQQSQLRQELSLIDYLWQQDKKQYHMEKDNIELINMKCHDMKHQITLLRENPSLVGSEQALNEMEDAIAIYDSFAKTGNAALDTILSQKLLFCEKNEITLTYMVDGHCLDFMDVMDLYSIFGNIIDNAIESVIKIEDRTMRIIGLNVSNEGAFLMIHIENYCMHRLTMNNGLPQTSKNDTNYHGFGLRSVRMLVDKYKGHLSISVENQVFNLNILIPVTFFPS